MLYLLLYVLFIVLIIYFILKMVKKVIYIIISFVIFFLLITSSLVLLTIWDYNSLKEGMSQEESILLLKDDSYFLTGGYLKIENIKKEGGSARVIENINDYNNKPFDEILGGNYKLIIVDVNFLEENLPPNIEYNFYNISNNVIINTLRSNNPKSELKYILGGAVEDINPTNNEIKLQLFLRSLSGIIDEKGMGSLLLGYKGGDIQIYKETMVFKIAKILPTNYINKYITN